MTLLDHIRNLTIKDPPTAGKRKLYKARKILGEGTFGVVKEAIYTPTGRHVALKSIRKRSHDSPEEVATAVHREMAVLQAVRHPHIIALLDYFETKDKYYLVFELATGGELYDRIAKKGKFTERDAARIIYTILDAVAFLHEKGAVHRDLKPENLLYRTSEPDADLVIADFGVSNFIHDNELLRTLCGSPMYAAPEVIKRCGHGKPADIWSIGVITYCLLAGYPPFDQAEDLPDLMDAITHARYKFDSPYWDSISAEAKDFVRRLLTLTPSQRPTARQAAVHPWLCKYVPAARAAEQAMWPITAPSESQTTLAEAESREELQPPKPSVIEKTEAKAKKTAAEEEEEEDLPNLVDRVWSAHSDSLFMPRSKLLLAFRTVQAMRRLSTKKRGAAVDGNKSQVDESSNPESSGKESLDTVSTKEAVI